MTFRHYEYLRDITRHPMNRGRRWRAVREYLRWNIGRRLLGDLHFSIELLPGRRVVLSNGENYATLAYTCRLYDFEDMMFLLHFLRPGDHFADCGANVGVYSVLAGSRGAQVLSVEPVPETFGRLRQNLAMNRVEGAVVNCGLGQTRGTLSFTASRGGMNRVALANDPKDVEVPVETLDELAATHGMVPSLIKVDVEGYESFVLDGARALLATGINAIIIELNQSGNAYGQSDQQVIDRLLAAGFDSVDYQPQRRELVPSNPQARSPDRLNMLFVRRAQHVQIAERLRSAEKIATRIGPV